MEMIAHQHPGVDAPSVAPTDPAEPAEEQKVILPFNEDRLAPVTARHHMVNRTGVNESQGPGHSLIIGKSFSGSSKNVTMRGPTPFCPWIKQKCYHARTDPFLSDPFLSDPFL